MHNWGDPNVDWDGINDAARFIGVWLKKYARMEVRDYKEKYGTVRVYCSFGWQQIHSILYPGYVWIHKWWPHRLDMWFSYDTPFLKWLNRYIVVPIHVRLYRWRYQQAIKKWPHLREEILCCADWDEVLKGL
jgi:hypothetical protein